MEDLARSDWMQMLPDVTIKKKKKTFMFWCSYQISFGMNVRFDLPVIFNQQRLQPEP